MELSGTQVIPAARDAVWRALNDPEVLRLCLAGCESVTLASPDEFRVVMAIAIGPMRARFNGVLRMTEVVQSTSCVMVFEGQGGAIGFGKGTAMVSLRDGPEGTELSYTSQAEVGGKLAQVGSRLIDSVARKLSDDFFKAFRQQLMAGAEAPSAPTAETPPVAGTVTEATPRMPAPRPAAPAPAGPVMVPGWWLIVAAVTGAAITLASLYFHR